MLRARPGAGNFVLPVNGLIISSPSFLIVNGGSPAERESGARAGPTPRWGKRGGVDKIAAYSPVLRESKKYEYMLPIIFSGQVFVHIPAIRSDELIFLKRPEPQHESCKLDAKAVLQPCVPALLLLLTIRAVAG